MSIFIFSFAVQVIIVQLSGIVFHVVPLTWDQWLICVALGFGSIPIGFVIRMIPFYKLLPKHKVDDEAFIQHDVARSLEESSGRHLTDADRIALQSYFERNPPNTTNMAESLAFNEGVKLGAQMALSLKSEDDDQEKSRESIAARERWVTAGARVRRQVGVVDAFRSHRR